MVRFALEFTLCSLERARVMRESALRSSSARVGRFVVQTEEEITLPFRLRKSSLSGLSAVVAVTTVAAVAALISTVTASMSSSVGFSALLSKPRPCSMNYLSL
jgi:hypothetical protein